ncbi:DMT family transporter [Bifidobacterium callitrichos]|uniref:Multidrug-transport integral membrane protein Mmr n=1 Tax=Bifidobacterium callitrichos DSM 23973 TaxID=1437609 RepID=A0A087A190_9BIFI|nr:SMR family transporter [Bifidobacterium callitrichos]KFI52540.1 multidrug-transport integral membrane protein Mmr [Bifidobacterium callitrichos DSM 23973]
MALTWLMLFGAIFCEVMATLSLRASEGFSKLVWAVPVVVGYGVCFFLLAMVLDRGMPTALAYGVWSCVGIIATAIIAHFAFSDPLNWRMWLGMAIMIVGIVVLQWGSHTAVR